MGSGGSGFRFGLEERRWAGGDEEEAQVALKHFLHFTHLIK